MIKNTPAKAGGAGLIPGRKRSPGGGKDLLEEEMATRSSILAWEIPRTEKPGGLQSMRSQRVKHNSVTKEQQQIVV